MGDIGANPREYEVEPLAPGVSEPVRVPEEVPA